jgi:hypothetical protein
VPLRTIAASWSVSKTALIRHQEAHIPEALAAARAAAEAAQADNLLAEVHKVVERAKEIVDEAQYDGDRRGAISALREVRSSLVMLANLAGALQDRPNVNILITPEWRALRSLIVETLEPYPDAKQAFVDLILDQKEESGSFSRA